MCMVIIVALVGTSYLAVHFTRRAKADLEQLLAPLAAHIDGDYSVDDASIEGRWGGTLVQARMAAAAAGTVRVWQVDLIDSAAGDAWNYVYSRPKKGQAAPEIDVVTENRRIADVLAHVNRDTIDVLQPEQTDWVQVEYSPEGGYVRVARPMHGRNDIPGVERFQIDLEFLQQVGHENRAMQERSREAAGGANDE